MKTPQTITSKIILKNPWLEIKEDEVAIDDTTFTYTYLNRIHRGAVVIPVEDDGSVWLTKQYRHPIKKILWQMPVEGKNENESWLEASQRGLAEEVGMTAESWQDLGIFYPDPGSVEQLAYIHIARDLTPIKNTVDVHHAAAGEYEEIETEKFSPEEIKDMIRKGEIRDGWTLGALYVYLLSQN